MFCMGSRVTVLQTLSAKVSAAFYLRSQSFQWGMVIANCQAILEAVVVESWVTLLLCLLSVLLSAKDVLLAWHCSAFQLGIPYVCQMCTCSNQHQLQD